MSVCLGLLESICASLLDLMHRMVLVKVGIGCTEEKRVGAGQKKYLNIVKTLLWLPEPSLSLYMFALCVNNGGSAHSSPALLSPCPIFLSSVSSSYHRRQQREKSSQTGKHKMSRDTPTTVPLSLLSPAAGSTSLPINVNLHSWTSCRYGHIMDSVGLNAKLEPQDPPLLLRIVSRHHYLPLSP